MVKINKKCKFDVIVKTGAPDEYRPIDVLAYEYQSPLQTYRKNIEFEHNGALYIGPNHNYVDFIDDNRLISHFIFNSDIMDLINTYGIPKKGNLHGIWTYTKRGSYYGVKLLEMI